MESGCVMPCVCVGRQRQEFFTDQPKQKIVRNISEADHVPRLVFEEKVQECLAKDETIKVSVGWGLSVRVRTGFYFCTSARNLSDSSKDRCHKNDRGLKMWSPSKVLKINLISDVINSIMKIADIASQNPPHGTPDSPERRPNRRPSESRGVDATHWQSKAVKRTHKTSTKREYSITAQGWSVGT